MKEPQKDVVSEAIAHSDQSGLWYNPSTKRAGFPRPRSSQGQAGMFVLGLGGTSPCFGFPVPARVPNHLQTGSFR